MNYSSKWGGIAGAILIIVSLFFYIMKFNIYNPVIGISSFLLTFGVLIVFMYKGATTFKHEIMESSLTYMQAFVLTFLTGVIAFYISALFSLILNAVIDPTYQLEQLKNLEAFLYSSQSKASSVITDDFVEKIIAETEKSVTNPQGQFLSAIATNPLVAAVMALLISFFVRTKTSQITETEY
jgi:hypothetical protein